MGAKILQYDDCFETSQINEGQPFRKISLVATRVYRVSACVYQKARLLQFEGLGMRRPSVYTVEMVVRFAGIWSIAKMVWLVIERSLEATWHLSIQVRPAVASHQLEFCSLQDI